MPPRKSNVSAVSATGDEGTPRERDGISVEDLALPKTMVQRLAKGVLPSNTRIEKDAITAMSKSATVFVNYLSNGANDRALSANRKTISPANVLEALADLEFAAFLPRVEAELAKFGEIQAGKRNEYRRKVKEGIIPTGPGGRGRKSAANVAAGGAAGGRGPEATTGLDDDEGEGRNEGEERASKRVRRGSGDESERGPEGQLADRTKANDDGDSELDEGDTALDAAIEAADAAWGEADAAEERGEDMEGTDEDPDETDREEDSELDSVDKDFAEALDNVSARAARMEMGLEDDDESANSGDGVDDDDEDGEESD